MIGVITAIIGIFVVSPRARDANAMAAINRGFFISAVISAVLVVGAALLYLPDTFAELEGVPADIAALDGNPQLIAIGAVLIGLLLAAAIQLLTGYFTETNRPPVREIGESSRSGPATVVLAGVSVGLESAVYSALLIAGAVYAAFLLGGGNITVSLFAVALAGTGLLTTVGVIVAMDTFGPVADNAQGIAEMSGDVEGSGAEVLNSLDAVGNTTKAITKGIAIATAVLAATALFGAFRTAVEAELGATEFSLSVDQPDVLVGVIIGAAVVFLFSGLAIMGGGPCCGPRRPRSPRTVPDPAGDHGRHGETRIRPSRRHLHARPRYGSSITPGLLAVLTPIALGFPPRPTPRSARSSAAVSRRAPSWRSSLPTPAVPGTTRRNSSKTGTTAAKALKRTRPPSSATPSATPFKDTAGPAINPLLKVMNLVGLLIAPSVVIYADNLALRLGITVASVALLVGVIVWSKRRSTDGSFAAEATKTQPEAPAADQGAAKEEPVSQGGGASSRSDRRLSARRKPVAPGSTRLPFPARRPWNPATFRVVWAPYSTHGRLTA